MTDKFFLWGTGGLALLAVGFAILYFCQKYYIHRLNTQIEQYLTGGEEIPLSVTDDALGHLQTNVCELQHRLKQEKVYAKQRAEENTAFLSDISHQLKTPLAGLRLYCELEHADAPSSHTEKELALIGKMEQLIQNVLTLEKIRTDAYEMHFAECSLAQLAQTIQRELQPLFPQKQITVRGEAQLRVDADWMHEALSNVVKNACEHTAPAGSVAIAITTGERSVEIAVSDDGGGVAPEELPLLFQRFHRTAGAVPGSTGVGLAITKAVVEKHHGILTAQNAGPGLQIVLCLPVVNGNIPL